MISQICGGTVIYVIILCALQGQQIVVSVRNEDAGIQLAIDENGGVFLDKDYRVVYPFISDEFGDFISYDLTSLPKTRPRREVHASLTEEQGSDRLYVSLNINNENLVLNLEKSRKLSTPYSIVEVVENRTTSAHSLKVDCLYRGKVKDVPMSSVAVSNCRGLSGMVQIQQDEYIIEPTQGQPVKGQGLAHKIYKVNFRSAYSDRGESLDTDNDVGWYSDMDETPTSRRRRSTSKNKKDKYNLELLLVADETVRGFHGNSLVEQYLLTLMNIVDVIYHHESLGVEINIVVIKLMFIDQEKADSMIVAGNGKETLEKFCVWSNKLLPRDSRNPLYHDFAVFISKKDIGPAGYAPVTGMCNPSRSCSVNKDEGFSSAFVIAHEIGHVFGMTHDGQMNNCNGDASDGRIMAPLVQSTFNKHFWSKCAVQTLHENLLDFFCLRDDPFDAGYLKITPPVGYYWSIDDQCEQEFGKGFTRCKAFPMPFCDSLWCSTPSNELLCKTKKGPPLDGTICGRNMWCKEGLCVQRSGNLPVDGSWSVWSSWNSCSRTCGRGVQFRTRKCNHPPPSNGGNECKGFKGQFRLCNKDECPSDDDFRAQQCTNRLDSRTIYGRKQAWLPYEQKDSSKRCLLTCVSKKTKKVFTSTKMRMVDGTFCSYLDKSNVCVRGHCKKVGCDGRLNSELIYDKCGNCGGDNSECTIIKGNFRKFIPAGEYIRAMILPKGARHIIVKDRLSNFLALRERTTDKFILNGNRRSSRSFHFIYDGTLVIYRHDSRLEAIRIIGPLKKDLLLMVYIRRYGMKASLSYEFAISNEVAFGAAHGNKETLLYQQHVWDTKGWTQCSKTCGTGQQLENYVCIDQHANVQGEARNCKHLETPEPVQRKCNTDVCVEYRWNSSDWGDCSSECGDDGFMYRSLVCLRIEGELMTRVEDRSCDRTGMPVTMKECKRVPCPTRPQMYTYRWKAEEWSPCSASCGNAGFKDRSISCMRVRRNLTVRVKNSFCQNQQTPHYRIECNREPCPAQWKTGPWSQCTKTCGDGSRARQVICDKPHDRHEFVCPEPKPEHTESCNNIICPRPTDNVEDIVLTTTPSSYSCQDKSVFCSRFQHVVYVKCKLMLYRKLCCWTCAYYGYY